MKGSESTRTIHNMPNNLLQTSERKKNGIFVCKINFPLNINNVINSSETSKSYAPNVKSDSKGNYFERFSPLI